MKDIPEYEKDLASIRNIMERSSKVISLSGLSGLLAGVYALAGAYAAYYILYHPESPWKYPEESLVASDALWQAVLLAAVILVASLSTGLVLSNRKAKKQGVNLWNPASQRMLINLAIPLVSGGIFILILLYNGYFALAAPACLVFYGIALIQGSSNTFDEIRYLGFCEILLGLVATAFPGYGLLFWTIGFGVLHIVYGAIMYNKYDK
jgi:hypothetical protein